MQLVTELKLCKRIFLFLKKGGEKRICFKTQYTEKFLGNFAPYSEGGHIIY